jgi:hypothetical protein
MDVLGCVLLSFGYLFLSIFFFSRIAVCWLRLGSVVFFSRGSCRHTTLDCMMPPRVMQPCAQLRFFTCQLLCTLSHHPGSIYLEFPSSSDASCSLVILVVTLVFHAVRPSVCQSVSHPTSSLSIADFLRSRPRSRSPFPPLHTRISTKQPDPNASTPQCVY